MRSYCAVYVDVGYLVASAATRKTGSSLRSTVALDHAALIDLLSQRAVDHSGLPLLRVHWYDAGAQHGGPDAEQRRIGLLPRVKLRLGRLGYSGEQKGVDLRIGLDLAAHARNRAIDIAYLVSGDDDLTEAVEEAQDQGVQVVVLAVPDREDHPHAVSNHLQRAADEVLVLDAGRLDTLVARKQVESRPPAPTPAAVVPPTREATTPVPSPSMLAARRHQPAAPARPVTAVPIYSSITGSESHPAPEFASASTEQVDQVCRAVLSSWLASASPGQKAHLRQGRPNVPADVDRALLQDMSAVTGEYYLDDNTRYLLRERFWVVLDELS